MKKEKLENYRSLISDITSAPRIMEGKNNDYEYIIFSIGEKGTYLSPNTIKEARKGLLKKIRPYIGRFDCICTVVPGGNQWALLIADNLQIPLMIIREVKSGFPDEDMIVQMGERTNRKLYIRTSKLMKRIIFIDDVISTGETVSLILKELKKRDIEIVAVFALILKDFDYHKISNELNIPIHGILQISDDLINLGP